MRITGGIYRSRLLKWPRGIRPTQDMVRKAVFDILGSVEGDNFLELFAGSGAVGLDALSRGAKEVVMVESDRESIGIIRDNIVSLDSREQARGQIYGIQSYMDGKLKLIPGDCLLALGSLKRQKMLFNLVFLDPPYHMEAAKKTLQSQELYDIVAPDGFVIVQHSKTDEIGADKTGFKLIKQSKYAQTRLSFFKKAGAGG